MSASGARQRVEKVNWYHSIPLDGLITDGKRSLETLKEKEAVLPADLSGKRVLDVGAFDGYYSFEAERRGAETVVAIDKFHQHDWGNEAFEVAREVLDSDVEYVVDDVLTHKFEEPFDVTICFGVLYHVESPHRLLDKLDRITSETLCIETAIIPSPRRRAFLFRADRQASGPLHARFINAIVDYDETVPSAEWLDCELEKRGWRVVAWKANLGDYFKKHVPLLDHVPAPDRTLPMFPVRYSVRAESNAR